MKMMKNNETEKVKNSTLPVRDFGCFRWALLVYKTLHHHIYVCIHSLRDQVLEITMAISIS